MNKRDIVQFIIAVITMIALAIGINNSKDIEAVFLILVMAANIGNAIYWIGRKIE